jgi:hypothetical protein
MREVVTSTRAAGSRGLSDFLCHTLDLAAQFLTPGGGVVPPVLLGGPATPPSHGSRRGRGRRDRRVVRPIADQYTPPSMTRA